MKKIQVNIRNKVQELDRELKEAKEYQTKSVSELTEQKKMLIGEVKHLRKHVSQTEKALAEYKKEFDDLKGAIEETRKICQD